MKFRYLRLQSQLQQLRGQLPEAKQTLGDVVDLAVEGFGEDSIQAIRARLDREAWKTYGHVGVVPEGCVRAGTRCSDEYNLVEHVSDVVRKNENSGTDLLDPDCELRCLRHFSCPEGVSRR